MKQDYVFGYGSLINEERRREAGNFSRAFPVRVKGLRRAWNLAIANVSATGVGMIESADSMCNGVVFSFDESRRSKLDKEEGDAGYRRKLLAADAVAYLSGDRREGVYWVYVGDSLTSRSASRENPIVQSYVDVILAGCLSFGESFAREFVLTTDGWDFPWVNDRTAPRYQRPMKEDKQIIAVIDGLLEALIPQALRNRR